MIYACERCQKGGRTAGSGHCAPISPRIDSWGKTNRFAAKPSSAERTFQPEIPSFRKNAPRGLQQSGMKMFGAQPPASGVRIKVRTRGRGNDPSCQRREKSISINGPVGPTSKPPTSISKRLDGRRRAARGPERSGGACRAGQLPLKAGPAETSAAPARQSEPTRGARSAAAPAPAPSPGHASQLVRASAPAPTG